MYGMVGRVVLGLVWCFMPVVLVPVVLVPVVLVPVVLVPMVLVPVVQRRLLGFKN